MSKIYSLSILVLLVLTAPCWLVAQEWVREEPAPEWSTPENSFLYPLAPDPKIEVSWVFLVDRPDKNRIDEESNLGLEITITNLHERPICNVEMWIAFTKDKKTHDDGARVYPLARIPQGPDPQVGWRRILLNPITNQAPHNFDKVQISYMPKNLFQGTRRIQIAYLVNYDIQGPKHVPPTNLDCVPLLVPEIDIRDVRKK